MADTILPVSMKRMKDEANTFFIELYILDLRTGTYYVAATDEDIEFNGQKYMAVPFQRENVVRSMDNIVDSCTITLADCNDELLRFLMDGFDFRGSTATVFRIQYPDSLTNPSIYQWMFSGFIDEPSFANGTFTCKIKSRFPEIQCPNRSYQLACNSEFGDESCGFDIGEETCSVVSVNGNELTLSKSFPDRYWKDGVVRTQGEARNIVNNIGSTLQLNVNFLQDDVVGSTVNLVRGCNKSQERCRELGNLVHYSGFPAIPFESVYR